MNFEFESTHKFFMNLNLNLVFSKSMNLNLNVIFSKSMNLNFVFSKSMNLNFIFSKSMNLNLNFVFSKSINLNLNFKKMNGSNPTLVDSDVWTMSHNESYAAIVFCERLQNTGKQELYIKYIAKYQKY